MASRGQILKDYFDLLDSESEDFEARLKATQEVVDILMKLVEKQGKMLDAHKEWHRKAKA